MRNWTAAVLAALMIWGLMGCAPADGKTQDTSAPQAASAALIAAPLAALSGIRADKVRQISVYGDSQPPDTPEEVYCTDADVPVMLGWLQGITAAPVAGPAETGVPGDWKTYEVVLFDGTVITVSFSGNTLSTGGIAYTYTAPAKPDVKKQLRLSVDGGSFPAGTETIDYIIFNESGTEAVLLFIPALGRAAPSGWVKLDCEAEFCGVPDPVSKRVTAHKLPLKEWFPDAGPGVYRLSMTAYDDNGGPYMIADVFEIK